MNRTYWKSIFIVLVFMMSTFGLKAFGSTYSIPHNGITDHANAAVSGSIAWHFSTYGAGHTYKLTTSSSTASYGIKSELHLPENAILTSDLADAKVEALSEMNINTSFTIMLWLEDGCTLSNVALDGARNASIIIRGVHKSNFTIDGCDLRNTRNYYADGFDGRSHIVHIDDSHNALIQNCTIANAGCNPKVDPLAWSGAASSIQATDSTELTVTGNTIDYALSHGVTFTRARNVVVSDNHIWYAGENGRLHQGFQTGDGVGSYHNGLGETWLNWEVTNNNIQHYGNHGMHLGGRGIRIEGNYISDGQANGISIQDWRDPHDCQKDIWIIDNYVAGYGTHPTVGTQWKYPILVDLDYLPGTIHISGTTGNTDVYWGSGIRSTALDFARWNMESLAPVTCPVYGDSRTGVLDDDGLYAQRNNHLVLGQQINPEDLTQRPTIVADGLAGNAMEFDGINDMARSSHPWPDTQDYEIKFDLYAEDQTADGRNVVCLTDSMSLRIDRHSDGTRSMVLRVLEGGSTTGYLAESTRFENNTWVHVLARVADGIISVTVDGEDGLSTGTYGTVDPVHGVFSSVWLGADHSALNPFKGRIDGLVIRDLNQLTPLHQAPHSDDSFTHLLLHMDGASSGYTPDDDSANPGRNHDGKLLNGPALADSFVPEFGQCYDFDGTQRIEVGASSSDDLDTPETGVRIECYARLDHAKGNDGSTHYLFLQPNRYGIIFFDRDTEEDWRLDFRLWTDGSTLRTVALVIDDPGKWHHYAMEYIDGTLEGFIDGVSMGTTVGGVEIGPALTKFYIGGDHQNNRHWEGPIDEFRIRSIPTYAVWIDQYPGVETATNKTDNPDGDILNNLAEWALDGNPDDAGDIGHIPTFETDGSTGFEYVYAKRSDADSLGLTYGLEQNTNLVSGSWSDGGFEIAGIGPLGAGFDSVTNRIPTSGKEREFIHLRIESD